MHVTPFELARRTHGCYYDEKVQPLTLLRNAYSQSDLKMMAAALKYLVVFDWSKGSEAYKRKEEVTEGEFKKYFELVKEDALYSNAVTICLVVLLPLLAVSALFIQVQFLHFALLAGLTGILYLKREHARVNCKAVFGTLTP